MNINEKISKINFWILFIVLAIFQIMILLLLSFYVFKNGLGSIQMISSIDYYAANQFSSITGLMSHNYFLFAIPFYLLFWWLIIKLGTMLIEKIDEHTQINPNNHMAILIILFLFPILVFYILYFGCGLSFNLRFGSEFSAIIGLFLMIIFTVFSEMEDHKYRNKIGKI